MRVWVGAAVVCVFVVGGCASDESGSGAGTGGAGTGGAGTGGAETGGAETGTTGADGLVTGSDADEPASSSDGDVAESSDGGESDDVGESTDPGEPSDTEELPGDEGSVGDGADEGPTCEDECAPNQECGTNACGESCGTCSEGFLCSDGVCEEENPVAACCRGDGSCHEADEATCVANEDADWLSGATCGEVECFTSPGICCNGMGECAAFSPSICVGGGKWGGASGCGPNSCEGISPSGACCHVGSCTETLGKDCQGDLQIWSGADTTCADTTCP